MTTAAKIPICLAAFGTTVPEAQEAYKCIENAFRRRFSEHDISWVFTSGRVREILRHDGIEFLSLAERLLRYRRQGTEAVAVQSLHVVPGQMDAALRETPTHGLRVLYGDPLLSIPEDIHKVIAALDSSIRKDRMNVLVAHGNDKHPEHNRMNLSFAREIESQYENAILWSVEGGPGLAKIDRVRKEANARGGVHFVPLMLVAGDHILNDVLGDEDDSWANQIGSEYVSCAGPLADNDAIVNIYADHLELTMAQAIS